MATPPVISKRKKAWRGKATLPPESTYGAVIYGADGLPIARERELAPFQASTKPLSPRSRPRTAANPTDIPSIVERYISLVGKVIADMDKRADTGLKAHEVNSVAAIGRAVAMLQAVESASLTRVGGKAVKDHTSETLQRMLAEAQAIGSPDASAADSATAYTPEELSELAPELEAPAEKA